jgi:hypothetical protein
MDLKSLIKSIKETQQMANRNTEELPDATKVGMISAVKSAQYELKGLLVKYGNKLLENSRAVFVSGDSEKAKQFAALPEKEGESITVDASLLYRRIADVMEPSLAASTQRALKQDHIVLAVSVLREVGQELDLVDMLMPKIPEYPLLPTYDALVSFVRSMVRNTLSDNLNVLYVQKQMIDGGTAQLYSKPTTNVVVLNATPEEIPALARVFTLGYSEVNVDDGEESTVDSEYVSKKLQSSKPKKK